MATGSARRSIIMFASSWRSDEGETPFVRMTCILTITQGPSWVNVFLDATTARPARGMPLASYVDLGDSDEEETTDRADLSSTRNRDGRCRGLCHGPRVRH